MVRWNNDGSSDNGRWRHAKLGCVLMASICSRSGRRPRSPARGDDGEEQAKWYDKLDFGGDFRLRYEGLRLGRASYDDGRRDRFRYRFRVGFHAEVRDDLTVGFQLSSGNPNNPISDNQSFDGGFSKNEISISEAYVRWQRHRPPVDHRRQVPRPRTCGTCPTCTGTTTRSSRARWRCFDVEAGRRAQAQVGLNLYQFVLNESGSGSDSYMFGGQLVPVFELNDDNQIAAGVGYESISHPAALADLAFDERPGHRRRST